jgi:hypothetical protein
MGKWQKLLFAVRMQELMFAAILTNHFLTNHYQMRRSKMGRSFLCLSRSWEIVKYSLSSSSITPTAGELSDFFSLVSPEIHSSI